MPNGNYFTASGTKRREMIPTFPKPDHIIIPSVALGGDERKSDGDGKRVDVGRNTAFRQNAGRR